MLVSFARYDPVWVTQSDGICDPKWYLKCPRNLLGHYFAHPDQTKINTSNSPLTFHLLRYALCCYRKRTCCRHLETQVVIDDCSGPATWTGCGPRSEWRCRIRKVCVCVSRERERERERESVCVTSAVSRSAQCVSQCGMSVCQPVSDGVCVCVSVCVCVCQYQCQCAERVGYIWLVSPVSVCLLYTSDRRRCFVALAEPLVCHWTKSFFVSPLRPVLTVHCVWE